MDEELFKRMQEAAERFRSGASDFEEILTPLGPAHLVRDESDPRGFRIDFVGGGSRHVVPVQRYPAAPRRPPGYPAPLPFLPDVACVVDTSAQSVTWPDPPDLPRALERLVAESLADGWSPAEEAARDAAVRHVLVKEGAERTVAVRETDDSVEIVLHERRVADAEEEG